MNTNQANSAQTDNCCSIGNSGKKARGDREKEMFTHIHNWESGQLTQKNYCNRHQIALPVFGYWLRKYRQLRQAKSHPNQAGFFPVRAAYPEIESLRVCYPGGVEIIVPALADPQLLRLLINIGS